MSFTLTTSGAIIRKAGTGANSTIIASTAAIQNFCDQAEATLSLLTRYDWVLNYSSVTTNFKGILDDTVSSMAAQYLVSYDFSGYVKVLEGQTILDLLRDNITRNIDALKQKENQSVMF